MKRGDLFDLLLLAALWGASFLFMRIAVPAFGPVALSGVRVVMAALALLPLLLFKGLWPDLRMHWKAIAVVGIVNSALPFMAYNYAALSITAGLSSVFNATSPLWVGLVAWLWLGDRLNATRTLGLGIGLCGVLWLVWDKAGFKPGVEATAGPNAGWAVAACLFATLCYGFGPNLTKRYLTGVPPLVVAAGSQAAAGVVLALPAWWLWPATAPSTSAWLWAAALGLFCTAAAYLLYFRLVANVGPARTITVTFLIPLFAVFWGWLFLGETITPVMAGACAVIVLGTALSTGLIASRAKEARPAD
jgi:drug/metabolite transporter (DMT)-like permease